MGQLGLDHALPGARRAVFAAVTGTLIEWYDYALYGAAAGLVIAPLFFAGTDTGATMAAFLTFAVGFIARPVGGLVIGHIGDAMGRRPAMLITIILMGIATVGIGALPTAQAIGALAPVLLVLLRLIQGMGAGAELAGAMTIVAEFAPPKRKGLYTSLVLSTPPAGIALATAAFLAAASLGDQALLGWAWRLPFLVSAVLFLLAIFIRRNLEETPEYRAAVEDAEQGRTKLPVMELLRRSPRELLIGFLAMTGHNCLNYAMAVFAISLMTSPQVGLERTPALLAVTLGSLVGVVATPFGGAATDRFGAARILGLGCAIGAAYAFPLLLGLSSGSAVMAAVAIAGGYGLVIALTSGSQGAFLAQLFPAAERYSGIAIAREVNGAIVAGLTPASLVWIIDLAGGRVLAGAVAVSAVCLISLLPDHRSPLT
ncbi:ABC transporter permease [Kocuria palustris]|nr:ABC transporter permease [Kocuria palustris]